ncbi:MAG: tRNA uridine(34) 5-carboxymethylaminomethyl modification radical SAM/GNAT enzyme Elp3 [Patescibacteria group bacterium]|nr:tRNA uridine(34) 5-carboxymethylaminomethyl modification radical SAM/GNAT enzyme Elp3 [Patescibacteria group bacterium]MDD5294432.1 tRNA uridine(34) 5-carboxymethylaminomethyl modification radical SAM/GNAT enzyme Elp3 [Patescibacteria group bacterium]MDD5554106.1 tRNA uridine(34) 5-carboxymethylaminomethyl modification radical SAM/GNAT enzyme Elp3 [Patescibacteria group bacterium]
MEKAIEELLKLNIKSGDELTAAKRKVAKKFKIGILLNSDILKKYQELKTAKKIKDNPTLERILRKRAMRTMSGIAPVAVLIKPYPCPGKCVYCPSEKGVPQSYLSNEPAVMRAILCHYDPYKQVQLRLRALEANGHEPNKIELIVIGATWSVLPEKYKYWFIKNCFAAANNFSQKSKVKSRKYNSKIKIKKLKKELVKEQSKNEKAKYRLIGITLETRPDYINEKELWQMRELGCTRVELGVQAIDNKILALNKRGHGIAEIAKATKLLKDFGFKVTYHIMPGLPGSTPAKDFLMFKKLFSDERFQPDQIKFYPTVVTRGSLLYKWWREGKYKPYSDKQLQNLIIKCKKIIPPYVRIIRLIRDIPKESIIAGNIITNLRQIMKDKGVKCNCVRCREVGNRQFKTSDLKLFIKKYKASGGQEYFISYESKDKKTLYGFCRLRLDDRAIIRELHVYGELVPVGKNKKVQHAGLGKKLMFEAEKIARGCGFKKIIVISGIGVREYYKKLGYKLENTYMVKTLREE